MKYPTLFSPTKIGTHELKNRIVALPTVPVYSHDNLITDRLVTFYGERAAGGAAVVVSEMLPVHETSVPTSWAIKAYDKENEDGLRRIAEAVEQHDCRMLGQIMHVGRQQLWGATAAPVGISDMPDDLTWAVPRVMNRAEIGELRDAFVNAAQILKECDFSGVEVHGATGHLITQFLSPWSNTRDDEYGGDLDGRTRFVREVIGGIRETCGRGFIIGFKTPGTELIKAGIDVEESIRIVNRIHRETPIDYAAFAQGNFSSSFDAHLPDMHSSVNPYLDLQSHIRSAIGGIPVLAFGRIGSPEDAELTLAGGAGDLVGFARALLSDPALPRKAAAGQDAQIRPCIFCNMCWGEIHKSRPIVCVHNPHLGESGEASWTPRPATASRRVTVVGAGVAGLEAAWIAAARGHRVTVLATGDPGGKARMEALLPGRSDVAKVYVYQYQQAVEHNVHIEYGPPADVDAVLATDPESIVLATGASMRRPVRLEADGERGLSVRDYVATFGDDDTFVDGTAVLFDFDQTMGTYGVAELLSARYTRTVILSPAASLGRFVPYTSRLGMYRRLNGNGIRIMPWQEPVRLTDGVLTYNDVLTGQLSKLDDVALFTWSTPRYVNNALVSSLSAVGVPVQVVGDCKAPRVITAAIHEGHRAGETID